MTATIMTRWWEEVEEAYSNQQIVKYFGMCTSYVFVLELSYNQSYKKIPENRKISTTFCDI